MALKNGAVEVRTTKTVKMIRRHNKLETETRPETFENEAHKNKSQDMY